MDIKKVGIIGTGTMGVGMAQVCAQAGLPTVAVKATPGTPERAQAGLEKSLGRMGERGKMEAAEKDAIVGRITFTTDEGAVADCDLVIESIIEDLETKKTLFKRLEAVCTADALLTTNTLSREVALAGQERCQRRSAAGLRYEFQIPKPKPHRGKNFSDAGGPKRQLHRAANASHSTCWRNSRKL